MTARKILGSLGRKRKADYVRWFREPLRDGVTRIRVQWRPLGESRIRTESFPDSRNGLKDAKAFAEGVHEESQMRRPEAPDPISLRSLLEKHIEARETSWAPATLRNLKWRYGKLELHRGRSTAAHTVTPEHLDSLKKALLKSHSPNQVRLIIKAITSVFRWGVERDLMPPSKVATYRVGKFSKEIEATAPVMAEYSAAERRAIAGQFNPKDSRQWRAFVATEIMRFLGSRVDATLSIEWPDVDFARGQLTWTAKNDKTGRERIQPLPAPVSEALHVAYGWAVRDGYTGPFVFYRPGMGTTAVNGAGLRYTSSRAAERATAKTDKPWTYQAYAGWLRKGEQGAKIKRVLYRGAHGYRRGVGGDIARARGLKAAAEWIGDKSLRVVEKSYVLDRPEELVATAALLEQTETAATKRNKTQRPRTNRRGKGVKR